MAGIELGITPRAALSLVEEFCLREMTGKAEVSGVENVVVTVYD